MDRPFEAEFSALFPERRPLYPDSFNNLAVAGRRVLITLGEDQIDEVCSALLGSIEFTSCSKRL